MAEVLQIQITADVDKAAQDVKRFSNAVNSSMQQTSKSVQQFTRTTGQANTALVNFGRVVQDAPFGLIGIANNIDPLIGSFQQLKAETGSTRGALKALATSLAGPAGIAIAVSAVTSALIAFGPEIKAFFTGIDVAGERAKAAAEAFDGAASSIANEAAQVETLVAVLKNENAARGTKLAALKELNRISPEYFNGLKLEGNEVKGLPTAYEAYRQSILAVARAKAATTQISQLYEKRLQLENKLVGDDLTSALQKSAQATAQLNRLRGTAQQLTIGPVLSKEESAALALNNQIQALDFQIQSLVNKTGPQFRKETQEQVKELKKQADALREAKEAVREYNANPALVTPAPRQQQAPATDFPQTLDELESSLGIINDLAQSALGQTLNPLIQKAANDAANVAIAFNLISPAIDQAFNALANGENVFESLQQAVKRLIVDLIKAAAIAVALSFIPGGAGLASPLSGTIGKSLGLRGFRANGGPVSGGQPYIVGERGPELFVPNQTGQIVANGGMLGAAQTLTARVDGNDLLFILNRATSAAGRRI